MHNDTPSGLRNFRQRSCKRILPACWFLGLVGGMLAAAGAGDSFFLMMRGGFSAMSIPGLLVTLLPFLFTALAVFLSQPWLLALLVLAKAFSFGFCAFGIMTVYSGAAWLVRLLLMFSDCCCLPLLMWLWLRHGDAPGKQFPLEFAACTAAALALGLLDICMVSPFAAMLL